MERNREEKNNQRRKERNRHVFITVSVLIVIILAAVYFYKPSQTYEARAVQFSKEDVLKEKKARVKELYHNLEEEGCPENILSVLKKNDETEYFSREYKKTENFVPESSSGIDANLDTVPYFLQWDEKWGYAPYGKGTIAGAGCGPTCLSMIVAYFTKDETITPYTMAQYSVENGFMSEQDGTYCALMEHVSQWGIRVQQSRPDETIVADALQKGHPIICNVMPGDFTQVGHFIVLTGYMDGKVTVNDPFNKKNSLKLWEFDQIKNQISMMWIYSQ